MWRILTVDDEPDVRAIIAATLRSKFEVFEAKDGLDALEKIKRVEPDFVIMDVMMPLMDGFQSCESIRKDPVYHSLPVLFLTALGTKDDIKKGYSVGANLYLTKPFDPMRLLKNVEVFFDTTPPPKTKKRHTYEELVAAEKSGKMPVAPGAADFAPDSGNRETVVEGVRRATPSQETWKMAPLPSGTSGPTGDSSRSLPRILAVDDDNSILDVMRMTLEGIVEFTWANDGIEAIEKLVKFQPDILIIDVMLPKMSGYTLCQSLRSNAAFSSLPILVCSAKGGERDISYARRMGANDYLVKPFPPDALIQKINDLRAIPGFRVRTKTLSMDEVETILGPRKQENLDVFEADEDARHTEGSLSHDSQRTGKKAMSDFLKKEGQKEAFDKTDPKAGEKKRTRLLFGFGKNTEE